MGRAVLVVVAVVLAAGCVTRPPPCDIEIVSEVPEAWRRGPPAPLPWDAMASDAPPWLVEAVQAPEGPEAVHARISYLDWLPAYTAYADAWHAYYEGADPALERSSVRERHMYIAHDGATIEVHAHWVEGGCVPYLE